MSIKKFQPILIAFLLINLLVAVLNIQIIKTSLGSIQKIKINFLLVVNIMLFLMSVVNYMRIRKMDASNPHAMVRSVMLGTLLKMVVFAGAALIYATQKIEPVGVSTLIISMGIYLVYTWLETRWVIKK